MKKTAIVIALIAALILSCVGCAGKSASDMMTGIVAPAEPAAPEPVGESGGGMYDMEYSNGEYVEPSTGDVAFEYGGRKVIKTGTVSIETDRFDEHYEYIRSQIAALGGYVENSYVSGRVPASYGDSGRYSTITARIPEESFEAFMTAAKGIGTLLSINSNTNDITANYYDIETRLEVLNVQHERLLALLEQAPDVESIIYIESELANVTLQIEQLTSELRRYDGLVSFSTVEVSLRELAPSEGATASATVWERMTGGFASSLRGVGEFFVEFGIFLVSALPVLIVLAIVAAVVIILIRRSVRKRRALRAARTVPPANVELQAKQEPDTAEERK